MLEIMARDTSLGRQDSPLAQRWAGLLHALQKRGVSPGAVFVVLIEQLADDVPHHDHWVEHWRQFVRLTAESGLPFLVVWSGTPVALQPVHQALHGMASLTEHRVDGLTSDRAAAPSATSAAPLAPWRPEILGTSGHSQCRHVLQSCASHAVNDLRGGYGRDTAALRPDAVILGSRQCDRACGGLMERLAQRQAAHKGCSAN